MNHLNIICYCQYLNLNPMSEQVQEISPLDISFSNDKGFEPSTPSQTSPPQKSNQTTNLRVTTPNQLFASDHRRTSLTTAQVSSFSVDTPPSRHAPKITQSLKKYLESPRSSQLHVYQTRPTSARKSIFQDSLIRTRLPLPPKSYLNTVYNYRRDMIRPIKRPQVVRWDRMDTANHLREISRLNQLINRINTHVSVFDKLYAGKRK